MALHDAPYIYGLRLQAQIQQAIDLHILLSLN